MSDLTEAVARLSKCLDDGWPGPAEAPKIDDLRTVLAAVSETPEPVYEYAYGRPSKIGPGVTIWRIYQTLDAFLKSGYATHSTPLGKRYRRTVGEWEEVTI